jgi:chromosome segregation ATPase
MSSQETIQPASSRRGGVAIPILFGLVIALVAANVFLFSQISGLKTELSGTRDAILAELAKVKEASNVTTTASRQRMEDLRAELEAARRQAAVAAGRAKKDALEHAEQIAKRLEEEQLRQQQQVSSELSQVKEVAATAHTKLADVSSEVGTVKTEVASTRSELEKTIAELKSVRGDLGVQSGLIATNAKELAALKALGERNYFEFNLAKTKTPQRVGDVAIQLKKTDPKRNRYTIEVIADDKRVEKKDKTANEPVQFYVSGGALPYEIVVNEVRKDRIVGYLATPKVTQARKG